MNWAAGMRRVRRPSARFSIGQIVSVQAATTDRMAVPIAVLHGGRRVC